MENHRKIMNIIGISKINFY